MQYEIMGGNLPAVLCKLKKGEKKPPQGEAEKNGKQSRQRERPEKARSAGTIPPKKQNSACRCSTGTRVIIIKVIVINVIKKIPGIGHNNVARGYPPGRLSCEAAESREVPADTKCRPRVHYLMI